MKAVFVSYNQSHSMRVMQTLDLLGIRGFTRWDRTEGRGTTDGEPHYGTHAWPSMNTSLLIFLDEEEKVQKLLAALKVLDEEAASYGIRAFVWNAEPGV